MAFAPDGLIPVCQSNANKLVLKKLFGTEPFCVAMLAHNSIHPPSINIETLDPEFEGLPNVTSQNSTKIDTILSNSFGFGGTYASLLLKGFPK